MSDSAAAAAAPPVGRASILSAAVQFGVLFLLIGPVVGTFVFGSAAAVLALVGGQPQDIASLLAIPVVLPGLALGGYFVGGLPALLAGLLVGVVSRWTRGWTLYPAALAAGALSTTLPAAALGFGLGAFALQFGAVGALAALVCAGLARHIGLERTG